MSVVITRRNKAVETLNLAEAACDAGRARLSAAVERFEKALNDARAEIGTARAELVKSLAAYEEAKREVLILAPDPEYPPSLDQLIGAATRVKGD
jgi:ABC-type transporter Mla subunit MlaD